MYRKKLSECVQKAWEEKETAEAECDLVKEKARELKRLLVPSMETCDEELEHLVEEVEDYKKSMKEAEKQMKSSTSAFMTAHATTLEYLVRLEKCNIDRDFIQKYQQIWNVCSVQWYFPVQNFGKNISSVVIGQYLRKLRVFLTHVANFCMKM